MKGKILIIEDDVLWQDVLTGYLTEAGYHVTVVSDLQRAIEIVKSELFHFITIDMQLDESTEEIKDFEGWNILEILKRLGIRDRTPGMVITGFDEEYADFKQNNKIKSLFFMGKGKFEKDKFIEIVDRAVDAHDLRFNNDFRD